MPPAVVHHQTVNGDIGQADAAGPPCPTAPRRGCVFDRAFPLGQRPHFPRPTNGETGRNPETSTRYCAVRAAHEIQYRRSIDHRPRFHRYLAYRHRRSFAAWWICRTLTAPTGTSPDPAE